MMTLSNIEKHSKIKKKLLSKEFYFQSLLQEANNQAELSDLEIKNIQMQCIKLLAENTEAYNKGLSSSVKVEVAQTIMASNLYTIGIYLKSLPDISSALNSVKNEPISKLYQKGHQIINTKLNVAKYLYYLVFKTKLQTPNDSYNDTIEEGIKSFFKQYNVAYEAHEIPASIDYQLMHPVTDLAGVEYIIQYLQNLHMENLFCSKFETTTIHEVMCGYDEAYKDLLVNIFGKVLQNAMGCALLHKDVLSLNLVQSDIQKLRSDLKNETKQSIYIHLNQIANSITKTFMITSTSLKTYINTSLPEFASSVHFAINNDTLQTIFVPRYSPVVNEVIKYSMGIKMNDEAYRNIVNEVLSCRYFDDKIQIIKEQIKTLSDMEDIIMDSELSEAEASAVFNILDDVEIAVLAKRYPYCQEIDAIDFSEAEIRMQRNLEKYLASIPNDKLKKILKAVSNIEVI